jgi:hypothetical protein
LGKKLFSPGAVIAPDRIAAARERFRIWYVVGAVPYKGCIAVWMAMLTRGRIARVAEALTTDIKIRRYEACSSTFVDAIVSFLISSTSFCGRGDDGAAVDCALLPERL